MKVERDQVHAHIDVSSGRTADIRDLRPLTGDEGLAFTEDRWGFPDEWLPRIVAAAARQHDRWRAEAADLKRRLAGSE